LRLNINSDYYQKTGGWHARSPTTVLAVRSRDSKFWFLAALGNKNHDKSEREMSSVVLRLLLVGYWMGKAGQMVVIVYY
jgi:hypothetical protein